LGGADPDPELAVPDCCGVPEAVVVVVVEVAVAFNGNPDLSCTVILMKLQNSKPFLLIKLHESLQFLSQIPFV